MAIAWQDRFTPLANVNNGNELEDGDTATGGHITVALENGEYVKNRLSYAHYITMTFSISGRQGTLYFTIIDRNATPITKETIAYRFSGNISCSGVVANTSTQRIEIVKKLNFHPGMSPFSYMNIECLDIVDISSETLMNVDTATYITSFTDNVI